MTAPSKFLIQVIKDVTIVGFQDKHIRDLPQIEEIGRELYELIEDRECRKLVLDFSKVQALSSQAIGVLVALRDKAQSTKSRVVLCCMNRDLAKLFKIAGLEKLFEMYDKEKDALASFGVRSAG